MKKLRDKKRKCSVLFFTLLLLLLTGCSSKGESNTDNYKDTNFAMGTVINQNIYGESGENGKNLAAKVLDLITNLENVISWRIEGTEIYRVNQLAGEGGIETDNEKLLTWLEECREVYDKSGGLLDITVGPAARLWDIGGDNPKIPKEKELEKAREKIDGSKLEVTEHSINLPTEGGQLDLGAVGKGIACDEIAEYLKYENLEVSGTFSVGGSVLVYGQKPDGESWKIGIQDPRGEEGTYLAALEIPQQEKESVFVSTSGDYEKYFEEDGVRYHHILDPRTGAPADTDLMSVTIVSDSGFLSDALSTACFVAGREAGMELAKEFGAMIIAVDKDKQVYVSEGLKAQCSLLNDTYQIAEVTE